ncbi:MAG: transcription antitermination factor NusB [Spirochaetales bacterium]|nr:transcription antitermination factor NusB [Spirochaetales bacterium]
MGVRHQGRIIAFQTLYRYEFTHEGMESLLDFSWLDEHKKETIKAESYDFARLIIRGTMENLAVIDRMIQEHLEHWDFSRLSRVDLANLRISVYGLMFQHDIPASVTIDEAIDIAKEFGADDSYRFVNGVLDSINKNKKPGQAG